MNDTAANSVTPVPALALNLHPTASATAARERMGWVALGGAFLFSMLWGIQSFGIQDNNEGLYAEVAREMIARRDWVVPHLNGVPYLEKPPLLYWIEALLLRSFGTHEWVVRLGPVLCFAGTMAAVISIGRQLRGAAVGRNAALLLCSAVGVVGMSRSLLFDGPLTCALTWTLAFFLRWRSTGSRRSLRLAYAAIGAGVMAKGLIAVVLGGGTIGVATFLARRSWRDLTALIDGVGITGFAAIVLPWHVLACLREPGFADFYFINEHVRRFLGTRQPHDFYTGPIYYYVVRLPLYLGGWFFTLPLMFRRGRKRGESAVRQEARRVLYAAAGLALLFFSLSEGKANYYLLCAMPAVALLIAMGWPRDQQRSRVLAFAAGGVAFIGIVFGYAPLALAHERKFAEFLAGQELLLASVSALLLAIAVLMAWFVGRKRNQAAFWCVVAAGLTLLLPLPALLGRADGSLSQRSVARFFNGRWDEPVVLYRTLEDVSSFVFYAGRPVPVLDSQSNELLYAQQHYPHSPAFTGAADLRVAAATRRVWIVARCSQTDDVLKEFKDDSARVVRRFPRTVVVAIGPTTPIGRAGIARQPVPPAQPPPAPAGFDFGTPILR